MQLLTLVNFTAAIQGLFLAYLLVNRIQSKENRLLALLVALMSTGVLGAVLGLSGYYRTLPHLMRIGDPLWLVIGPLIYFYIHLLTSNKLPAKYGWHLFPFCLYVLTLLPFYSLSGEEKIAFGERVFFAPKQSLPLIVIQIVRIVHFGSYSFLSLQLIRRFKCLLLENYSDIGQLTLDTSATLLRLCLIILLACIGIFLLSLVWPIHFVLINNIVGLSISLFIYSLAYSTWNRPALVMIPPTPHTSKPLAEERTQEKSRNNFYIPEPQYTHLTKRLEQLLQEKQIYLESELSLSQLSEQLGIPAYQTSELLHRHYQESFFDVINRHRIEEIKKRFDDPAFEHYSILGIAMDCGFNSKSSFNTAFKKFTGLTPSQYRSQ
jgi:AraC-like DNA-binding protein